MSGNNLSVSSLSQHSPHHLTYLAALDLSHNVLAGELSGSVIDSMVPAGVKMLDLGWNKITGTREAAFSHLTALTNLNLQGNKLEEIPDLAFTGEKQGWEENENHKQSRISVRAGVILSRSRHFMAQLSSDKVIHCLGSGCWAQNVHRAKRCNIS